MLGDQEAGRKNVQTNTFKLTWVGKSAVLVAMNATTTRATRWCWRKDLAEFRGLSDRERAGFLLVLEWFENFRLRHELEAGRDAAKAFWRSEVLREGCTREAWQLEQWSAAIQWYLNWLRACAEAGGDHRSLAERVRAAVYSACSRRGLARRTKQCYGAWAARYAVFAGDERAAMQVETATRFLTSVVDEEDCAYSTQKQALNAPAFFFKQVCGAAEPVVGGKLRPPGPRVRAALAKGGTRRGCGKAGGGREGEGAGAIADFVAALLP